jgi:hypothetical protein
MSNNTLYIDVPTNYEFLNIDSVVSVNIYSSETGEYIIIASYHILKSETEKLGLIKIGKKYHSSNYQYIDITS